MSDDLVPNVLFMISLATGGLTGMLAYMLEQIEALSLTSLGVPLMTSFVYVQIVFLIYHLKVHCVDTDLFHFCVRSVLGR